MEDDKILNRWTSHQTGGYRKEHKQQNIGQEESRKLNRRTAEYWTGGQQNIGEEESRILDRRTGEN